MFGGAKKDPESQALDSLMASPVEGAPEDAAAPVEEPAPQQDPQAVIAEIEASLAKLRGLFGQQ
jgi:hypothetical protein